MVRRQVALVRRKHSNRPLNLLSVVFGQIYFPTYSNGLKDIAGWLDSNGSDQDVSGVSLLDGGTPGTNQSVVAKENSSLITWRIAPRWNWSPVPLHKPATRSPAKFGSAAKFRNCGC